MNLEAMTTRILLVDDDLELRTLLCDYLGRQGIEVSTLHDAGTLLDQWMQVKQIKYPEHAEKPYQEIENVCK